MVSGFFRHPSRPSRNSPALYISEICEALAKSIMPIACGNGSFLMTEDRPSAILGAADGPEPISRPMPLPEIGA
jgi:hypothetical protein